MNNIASLTHLYCGNNFKVPLQYALLSVLFQGVLYVCSVSFHHKTAVVPLYSHCDVFITTLGLLFPLGLFFYSGGYVIGRLQEALS